MTYKLVCFDLDGVIFKPTNFWMELHKKFGTLEQGIRLTQMYLYTDYDRLVEEVVTKLWKEKDVKPYYDLVESTEYYPGVKEVFDHLRPAKHITAIVSTSSIDLARRVQRDHNVDYIFANELVIRDGKVTGEFIWPVGAGRKNRTQIINDLCSKLHITMREVIYIGDSDSDIEACKEAGMSIAFNSFSEELKECATHTLDTNNLADILQYIP